MSHYTETIKNTRSMAAAAQRHAQMWEATKAGGADIGALIGGGAGGGVMGGLLGGSQNQRKMQAAYAAFKGHVYSCIKVIAQRLASQPYGAGEIINDDAASKAAWAASKQTSSRWLPHKRCLPASIKAASNGAAVEAYLTHPALDLLNRPNHIQGKFAFLYTWVANMFLAGEAYWIGGDGENGPELWMPPTNWIVPKHEGGLYTGFELKPAGASVGVPLEPEMVRRTYFPDPHDVKGCVSPVLANLAAIKVDESIQRSQEQMFERGIFPNVVLTVGQNKNAEGKPAGMPTLTGPQRRQVIRAVREVWASTASNQEPAIVDGLISGIHKLSNMPAEMDWMQSGEQVKGRVFEAFGVSQFMVGKAGLGSYAQASVVEQNFLGSVINPLGDDVTTVLNEFVAPMFDASTGEKAKGDEKPKSGKRKLYLWIEKAEPINPELRLREFQAARQANDCTRNEFRTEILGLPAMPEKADMKRVPLLDTVGGITGTVQVLTAVGLGQIGPESAANLFRLFFEMDDATAEALVSDTADLAMLAPPSAFGNPKLPDRDTPPPDDDESDGAPELPDVDEQTGKMIAAKSIAPRIKRSSVKANSRRQQVRLERQAAVRLRPFSRASTSQLLQNLLGEQIIR